jgi:hypothetical protein
MSHFECERRRLHEELCRSEVVTLTDDVVSFSDSNNALSRKISLGICKLLHVAPRTLQKKLSGQTLGERTERCVAEYLRRTFPKLQHLRPGSWTVTQSTRNGIADFEQYEHLSMLQAAARRDAALAVALGNDYIIKPDVLMVRNPEPDSHINAFEYLVDETVATRSALRAANNPTPILHASVSTKLTLRSDRAQNARTESLNLLRNRKGRAPHIVVVTAEPLPSRLASLALGTGDIDCVYHLFLRELIAVVDDLAANSPDAADTKGLLDIMLQGRRLKDVTDLPLDLAV